MSYASAIRNLSALAWETLALRMGWRRGTERQRPETLDGLVSLPLDGTRVHMRPYRLRDRPVIGQHPRFGVPKGWHPLPDLGLDRALPYGWDTAYVQGAGPHCQPVKLWRNAIVLSHVIETASDPDRAAAAQRILADLAGRMRAFTVPDGRGGAWLETRQDYTVANGTLRAPWVSAIANAFALLACLRMRAHLPVADNALAYGRAFGTLHRAGTRPASRWISMVDRAGYLWFDEYPHPRGHSTRVLNGHIFAVMALHELNLWQPGQGFGDLARAGLTSVEAHALCFRRPGRRNLYALDLPRQPDYLADRAMRQFFQLYDMTGHDRFLELGDLFHSDAAHLIEDPRRRAVEGMRTAIKAARSAD